MFEKGIRVGIIEEVKRYVKTNNKYTKDQYNPDEKSTYLQCLNANNLYEWTIIQKLSKHRFTWERKKIDQLMKKGRQGCVHYG